MSFFNRLFGKKASQRQPFDPNQFLDAFQLFVNAGTWEESQRIVERNPLLLDPKADDLLSQLAATQSDLQTQQVVQEHGALLRRCREIGVPRAFAEKRGSATGDEPEVPPLFRDAIRQADEAEQLFLRTGDRVALDTSVAAWERILNDPTFARSDPHFQLAVLTNAGTIFLRRYQTQGKLADLNRALEMSQQAMQQMPANSPNLRTPLSDLGVGLRDRYARTGDMADLEEAISVTQRAVGCTPPDSPDLPMYLTNLGLGLRDRYARTGDLADLDEAIRVTQSAVGRISPDSPKLPGYLNNMGIGLSYRYARTGDMADLEDARSAYSRACKRGLEVSLEELMHSARNWGNWALGRRDWGEATEAFAYGRQAIDVLCATQTSRQAKESWLKEVQGLSANAAYALTRLGKLEEAVAALESGRARLLAEALEQNRRDLERLVPLGHIDLLDRYRQATDSIQALQQQVNQPVTQSLWGGSQSPSHLATQSPPEYSAWRQEIEAARRNLNTAIAAIRQIPGYEDFFLPLSFGRIQQAATSEIPLAYLVTTTVGSMVLVVRAPKTPSIASEQAPGLLETPRVSVVWLDALPEARLLEALQGPADDSNLGGYLGAYDRWRSNPRDHITRQAWYAALDQTTRWLWIAIMKEVVEHLQALGARQAVLITAGLWGLLPLHAAWTEDFPAPTGRRYALDTVTFSYAPGARALAESQARAQAIPADGLLAVDNPDGSLVFSRQEVEAVRSYFPTERANVLQGAAATRQAVLDQFPNFPIYHFSTHGWAGWSEPLEGGLVMAGGSTLTLADLLDLRLEGARLAVLSACETGIPGTKLPDEVVSLPTGLVQAGVAGVVASLWAVNDLSTAMLMERFYRLWRQDGLTPAEALCEAQCWLRDSTNREKAEYFKRDVPALAGVRMPAEVAADLYVDRMLRQHPDGRDFAHPFWWAAFSLTGV